MLTGDQAPAAARIADDAGIRHYRAGVSPQDKADFVAALQREGHRVPWWATASTTVPPWPAPT